MVFYIVSPYVFPPKHHSSTNDSNRESGVQVAVAITSPQVLNTCPCRRGWGEMKPRKYTIWEHPTMNWWFLKSSSLFVSSSYFQFKDLLPPQKKKNETMIKAKPAPAVQEEPHPGKCDACEAAPCDRDAGSFFRDGSQRGKGSATHIPQREDDENWSAIGEIVRTLRMNRVEKKQGKNLEPHWPSGNFEITSDACSNFQCAQHPATTNWKLILDLQLKSVAFFLEKSSFPVTPSSLVKPMR